MAAAAPKPERVERQFGRVEGEFVKDASARRLNRNSNARARLRAATSAARLTNDSPRMNRDRLAIPTDEYSYTYVREQPYTYVRVRLLPLYLSLNRGHFTFLFYSDPTVPLPFDAAASLRRIRTLAYRLYLHYYSPAPTFLPAFLPS